MYIRPVYTEYNHDDERGHLDFPRDFPLERSHEATLIQNAVIRAVTAAMCVAAGNPGLGTRKQNN